jgi:energy-coupling factor transporter transmembrane protein EcfT
VSLAAAPFAYVPGTSRLHRVSAVPKLIWLAAALAFALCSLHPLPLLGVTGIAVALALWAGVGWPMWRAMRVLGPLAASIIVLQVATPASCPGGCTALATIGPLTVTAEALGHGIAYVARLLAMASAGVVVLVTTRPADLFGALRRLHVPYAVALVLATTMDLVPLLSDELTMVLDAQRARGLRAAGFRALVPAVVPVFVGAFERVGRLAIAMEARGYGAGHARSSYRTSTYGRGDRVLAWVGLGLGVVGVTAGLTVWNGASVPPLVVPAWAALAVVGVAGTAFLLLVGATLVAMARA